jgi:chorismate mutase
MNAMKKHTRGHLTKGRDLQEHIGSNQISGIRSNIDKLDRRIANLLAQRLNLVQSIAGAKSLVGMPVRDPGREEAVLANVAAACAAPTLSDAVQSIYESIISESRKLQRVP